MQQLSPFKIINLGYSTYYALIVILAMVITDTALDLLNDSS